MDIVILATGYLGTRQVALREVRNVQAPEDFAGVELRRPPGASFQTLARAMNITPVAMPITEVYLALQTGAIDGPDNPGNMTRDWTFDEVTKEVVLTDHLIQPVFQAGPRRAFPRAAGDAAYPWRS
jgi:TRAP-type C4-dicarboxylate transport system substrate-binding protein